MPRVLALPRCCVQASRGTRISPAWDQGRLWRAGASTGGPSGFAEHWQVTRDGKEMALCSLWSIFKL